MREMDPYVDFISAKEAWNISRNWVFYQYWQRWFWNYKFTSRLGLDVCLCLSACVKASGWL